MAFAPVELHDVPAAASSGTCSSSKGMCLSSKGMCYRARVCVLRVRVCVYRASVCVFIEQQYVLFIEQRYVFIEHNGMRQCVSEYRASRLMPQPNRSREHARPCCSPLSADCQLDPSACPVGRRRRKTRPGWDARAAARVREVDFGNDTNAVHVVVPGIVR